MSHPATWSQRTMVCLPVGEIAFTVFWKGLHTLEHFGWHIDQGLVSTYDAPAYIQDQHNKLVEACLEVPYWDRLLWLEHDHTFPRGLLEHVSQYEEPIVGGLYHSRSIEQPTPCVYKWANRERTTLEPYQPYEVARWMENPGLHPVDVIPMGCTSIRRDVFENWPEEIPWYSVATSKRRQGGIMGDDVWFCRHAQDQGYQAYVDSRVLVQHWMLWPMNTSVYNAWVGKMKAEGRTGPAPKLAVVK